MREITCLLTIETAQSKKKSYLHTLMFQRQIISLVYSLVHQYISLYMYIDTMT